MQIRLWFDSRRRCFVFLCTVFFSVCCLFLTLFFLLAFYSLFLLLTVLVMHLDQYIYKREKGKGKALDLHTGQAYDQKKNKTVPPLKQLNFFQLKLVDIMTNNTQYTTNCTNLHPTPTSDSLQAKVKLAFCTSS